MPLEIKKENDKGPLLKIGIIGALGRMGQEIARYAHDQPNQFQVKAACVRPGHTLTGQDYGKALGLAAWNLSLTDNYQQVFQEADVVIDFSSPSSVRLTLEALEQYPRPLVIGVTGFKTGEDPAVLCAQAAARVPVFYSVNMSPGVTLLGKLVKEAARCLSDDYQIEIIDYHHQYKKDAPSGTAVALAQKSAQGRNQRLEEVLQFRDSSASGRSQEAIHISSIRAGGMIGTLEAHFVSMNEKITLSQQAFSRSLFAQGALKAAQWLKDQKPGFYGMEDMLAS